MTQFTNAAEQIVQQLWTATWQGSLAVILAVLVLRLAHLRPATLRCWVWRLVCVKMLVAFFWLGTVELPLLVTASTAPRDHTREKTAAMSAPGASDVNDSIPAAPSSSAAMLVADRSRKGAYRSSEFVPVSLVIGWLAGVFWQTAVVFFDWRKSRRLVQQATKIQDVALLDILSTASARIGITTPQLRLSKTLTTPVAVGIAHPTVILPVRMTETFNESQMNLLLMHELAHIRRRDLMWNWLGVTAGVLFFFNPFVWGMQRRWRQDLESACDELVLGNAPNSLAEYADMLLQCSIPGWHRDVGFTSGATTTVNSLRKRIEQMKYRKRVSKQAFVSATCCLVFTAIVGIVPWKLVPAVAAERSVQPTAKRKPIKPGVSVAKTFEIAPNEVSLVHDGDRPKDDRQQRRQQFRHARRLRMSGRLGRGGSRGGTRSNVAGGTQVQGPNSSGAGGFASGTMAYPNYGVALQLSAAERPADTVITLAEGVAIDADGNEYEPFTQLGMSRMAVPHFEAAHPDCAGAYFRLSKQRRPKSFKEMRGKLRVTPVTLHEARFLLSKLTAGTHSKTDFGQISIGRFNNQDGWKFEVKTPGPGMNTREIFRYAGMVHVELIDSEGNSHRPRMKSGSGGGGGVNGNSQGIDQITQIFAFEELEGVKAQTLLVRIRELGEAELIPFSVRDVALP